MGIRLMKKRYFEENPKGVSEVCKMLEEMRAESYEKGKTEGVLASIVALMKNKHFPAEQAMDLLDIPLDERGYYLKRIFP